MDPDGPRVRSKVRNEEPPPRGLTDVGGLQIPSLAAKDLGGRIGVRTVP